MDQTIGPASVTTTVSGNSSQVMSSNIISATALETFLSHVDVVTLLEDVILHPVSPLFCLP
jgi:hypothetical protein